jgi:hypothetical protein
MLIDDLQTILNSDPWQIRDKLAQYIAGLDPEDYLPAKRTASQNSALHLGCRLIADALNDAGLDIRKVIKPEVEISWTVYSVKDYLFRPVMKTMTGKDSTTELNKLVEIDKIWDTVMRFLGQNHGIEYIPFPNDPNPAPLIKDYEKP